MSLYVRAKTRVRVDSELSEEFEVKVGMYQGYVRSTYLPVVMVDVITELARDGVLCELLYADDLILMSETIEGLMNKFLKLNNFEVEGQRKKGSSMRTWKKQVEDESMKIGLRRKDALCH